MWSASLTGRHVMKFSQMVDINIVLHDHFLMWTGVKLRDTLRRPLLSTQTLEQGHVIDSAIKCAMVRNRKQFLGKGEQVVNIQQEWKQYAT